MTKNNMTQTKQIKKTSCHSRKGGNLGKEKSKKVPTLRFGEFSGEWEEKKFIDVFKIGSGKDHKHLHDGNIPVFGTGGYMRSVNKKIYGGKTVFIGRKGTIDKPFYYDGDFWTVDTLFYTYDFKGITPEFTNLVFQQINWQKYNEASGVPSLSKSTIEKIKVALPKKEEQRKIADFLGGVDVWIENLEGQKEELEKYKKGIMQKIFSQEIRFHDKNKKDFPDWEEKKLGEIGENYNGLTGKTKDDFGKGKKFITYKQIFDNNYIDIEECKLVDVKDDENQNMAKYGDIFFTTSSETPEEIAFSSVLLDKNETVYLNSFSFGFRPNSLEKLNPKFAKFFFRNLFFRKEVIRLAQGSTRYNMSKVAFMKIKINLPSLPEQKKIADFLSSIDEIIQSKQEEITKAKNWKKGLMQMLFV